MDTHKLKATGCHPCAAPNLRIVPIFLRSSWPKPKPSNGDEKLLSKCGKERRWSAFCTESRCCHTRRLPLRSTCRWTGSGAGVAAGRLAIFHCWTNQGAGESSIFPPLDRALVQAIACELIYKTEQPLSRQSVSDLTLRAR